MWKLCALKGTALPIVVKSWDKQMQKLFLAPANCEAICRNLANVSKVTVFLYLLKKHFFLFFKDDDTISAQEFTHVTIPCPYSTGHFKRLTVKSCAKRQNLGSGLSGLGSIFELRAFCRQGIFRVTIACKTI